MRGNWKAIGFGFMGAVVGLALCLLAYTAYQDHKALWDVVGFLNAAQQRAAQQQTAPQK